MGELPMIWDVMKPCRSEELFCQDSLNSAVDKRSPSRQMRPIPARWEHDQMENMQILC